MQARKTNRLPCQRPLIAALAAIASCSAWAEDPSPFYIGVTQSLTRDSNVNRFSDSVVDPQGRSDTYSSTGLVGGFDQPFGRQNFHGTADLRYNRYQNHDNLNNTSYGVNAGWDWATLYNLSGGVNVSANQSLAQLNGNTTVTAPTTSRNLVKTDQVGANVAWGGTGLLSLQGSYTHSRARYSNQGAGNSDSSGDTGSIGANYNLSPSLSTGVALRLTRSDAALSGSSDGRNIDLLVNWRYTVQTGVNARLSFTRQSNAGGGNQDFSGLTGSIAANYAPTGKLAFSLSYNRDAGTNGTFFNAPVSTGTTTTVTPLLFENSQVTDSIALGATYSATAKINVTAGYQYRKSRITNNTAAGNVSVGGDSYDDKLQTASLSASWAIARPWQLSCNLSHEKRDTSSTSAFSYTANVVSCSAQLTFR